MGATFIDEASIEVFGGNGGNGCSSFRREKYVPHGGPDGGDGGAGGTVWLVASEDLNTLLPFRYRPLYKAARGKHGEGSNRTGRAAEDLIVEVPVGTLVFDEDKVRCLADLDEHGARFLAATGGRGGRGNPRFVSSVQRAPTRCDAGEEGDIKTLRLELKLLADIGLVGLPNAGKSTFLSRVSSAHPKIADYPFTTLTPNLGVVPRRGDRAIVIADIPGLIEGAHEGHGLGDRFLRHVERCRWLLHLVDPIAPDCDPVESVRVIDQELARYSKELNKKPQLLVATKADSVQDQEPLKALRTFAEEENRPFFEISAVRGDGLEELLTAIDELLETETQDEPQPVIEAASRRIGVLGGTFDPVHSAHLAVADQALRHLHLDRVLFMPCSTPPHKPNRSILPAEHRMAMLERAIAGDRHFELSTLELDRGGISYSWDTLEALQQAHPEDRFFFILGADALDGLENWHRARELVSKYSLIVCDRRPAESVKEPLPDWISERIRSDNTTDEPSILRNQVRLPAISSREIRNRVQEGLPIDTLVPSAVDRYIRDLDLYQEGE